ncbi:MAG: prepilin-type N-terminal cleavage/methylation domain-containing protein [Acidobacteria bacterium]|nr:prepilin-type N-terminal cleavage/methylation domain-containing protein [Acidobacteriota bacterium]
MKNKKTEKPRCAGFSLTEVLIAVAMMSALSAIAVPMLSSSMRNMQLAADAQNISTTLAAARLSAKSLMTPHRIRFNTGNNEWKLERFNRASGTFELQKDVYKLSGGVANSGITFLQNSASHPGTFPGQTSAAITFNSLGIPVDINNAPTPDNIVYISKSGADYAITVSLTGKVQVWKQDEGQWEAQ